jgi:hypothetical protein
VQGQGRGKETYDDERPRPNHPGIDQHHNGDASDDQKEPDHHFDGRQTSIP